MVNPINYIVDTPDPLASVLDGFNAGTAIRRQPLLEQREAEDRARLGVVQGQEDTQFGNEQVLFEQGQQDRLTNTAEAERQRNEARQMQADIQTLGPNSTAQDFTAMSLKYPQMGEELRATWGVMDEANRSSTFRSLGEIYAATASGNVDVAKGLLTDRIEAMKNSNRPDDAAKTEAVLAVLEADPDAALVSLGLSMSSVDPDGFTAMFTGLEDQRRKREEEPWLKSERFATQRQAALDAGLTEANITKVVVETARLNDESRQAALDFATIQAGGVVDVNDRFNFEDKLRKEYVARIGKFPEARTNFDKLNAAATVPNPETGAGDVALVFAFMKMLDPGSVVRESEFALAQNTGGILTRLQNTLTKAERGEFMTPTQRSEMVALASKFMEAAQSEADKTRADLMIPVNNWGLSAENVFGTVEQSTDTTEPDIADPVDFQGIYGGGN